MKEINPIDVVSKTPLFTGNGAKGITNARTNILVVDDEIMVGEVVQQWLKLDGYDCDCATGAITALGMLKEKKYDLLISDIMMPGVSGLDLLGKVKSIYPEMAVVMATAVDDRETARKALDIGADGYAVKPFHMNEFLINIANVLEKNQLTLNSRRYNENLEEKIRERTSEVLKREEEIALRLIAATGFRDGETGQHIKRLGLYSMLVATALGWDQKAVDYIKVAAPMHDVGKIGIPDHVLLKPGSLTGEEFEVLKGHPAIGATILGGSNIPLLQMAVDIALCHHEKWDGTGYPEGLSREEIPESARIVAVVDVYDALCHDRIYRKSFNEEDVVAIMDKKRGTHFDPLIYDCFKSLLPKIKQLQQGCED